ncbi:MAG: hypothetical protein CVT64_10495 [Actinobacteria bacterium HGW-Actinobacteria-4]|nr:MAG: hypothetical protein CVT64_10495 [Actinobacteria bacterium HGW-Actinobacteria-4]
MSPTSADGSGHLWWNDVPSSTPDEDAVREAARVEEAARFEKPKPPRTWKRWIPHGVTALSSAILGWLVIALAIETSGSEGAERQQLLQVYVQIVWIAVGLGLLNVWIWRRR